MAANVPIIHLDNKRVIPMLGFGTWFRDKEPDEITDIVSLAIENGYRLIDCVPEHEIPIGKAIRSAITRGIVHRKDLYIVVKLPNTFYGEISAYSELRKKLGRMSLRYVDLYLMTWPFSHEDDDNVLNTWFGMSSCVNYRIARSIGVCNFNYLQLHNLCFGVEQKPAVLQIEEHVNLVCDEMLEFCYGQDIIVMSHSPFGIPKPDLNPPSVNEFAKLDSWYITIIALRHKKTNYQIGLRYLIQLGTIPIPRSSSVKHMKQNIDIFDFCLSKSEMTCLKKLDIGRRTFHDINYFHKNEYPFGYIQRDYIHLLNEEPSFFSTTTTKPQENRPRKRLNEIYKAYCTIS